MAGTQVPDWEALKNRILTAIYGKDVRAALAALASGVEYAIDHQITQLDPTLTEANQGAPAKVVGENLKSTQYVTDMLNGIKNAIFTSGWYDVPAEQGNISERSDSETYVCAVIPVEAGDYVFLTAKGGGTPTAGARAYAFTNSSGVVLSRAGRNAVLSDSYLIAPQGSAFLYVNNSLSELSSGYYAYVGYALSNKSKNIRNLENGVSVYADYQSGYYSDELNPFFPTPNVSAYPIEAALIPVNEGEIYTLRGNVDIGVEYRKYGGAIIYDESGNVIKSWLRNDEYSISVYIPAGGAYLASNTRNDFAESYISKYNNLNAVELTEQSIAWESGGIADRNGISMVNVSRIRCTDIPIYPSKDIEIIIPDGYVGLIYKYDETGEYLGYQTPWTNVITTAALSSDTKYIRIVLKSNSTPTGDISDKVTYISDNFDVREATLADAKDVQELVTAINYFPDVIFVGKSLDTDGNETVNVLYKTTDYVALPKKYNKNLVYTHAFSESGNAPIVAFYDEQKDFVEIITSDTDSIQNLDTYVYARAVYPVSDTECDLSFTNENVKPDYAPAKKYLLYTNDLNSYDRNVIADGTINAIINTGLMYLGDERFGYGTEHTAFAEYCIKTTKDTHISSSDYDGERYQMDCSTYSLLMMMGITPECSRYFYSKNIPSSWGYKFNRLAEYEGYVYDEVQDAVTKRMYANTIAEYAYKNGYLFLVNDDLSNLRAGDIFFLSNQPASYNFFENIGHCGFVVDCVPMENGGQTIVTFEANGGTTAPCKYHTYNTKSSNMIYAARLPMQYVYDHRSIIADMGESVTTALNGSNNDTLDIATISLDAPLEAGRQYTVCVKCELPENCYLKLKTNGMSNLGVSNANVLKRPDGFMTLHIFAKMTDTITPADSITIQAKCTGTVSGTAVLSMAHIYDGYVTPEYT